MTTFTFYTPENSQGKAKELLTQAHQGYGFIPNLYAYMAEAPVTIEAYNQLNTLLGETAFTPAQQQVALLAASVENECDFCTVAHRAIGRASKANQQTLDALAGNDLIEDASDRALVDFVRTVVRLRGHASEVELQAFYDAGFTKRHVLEVVLIVSIKTLTNYINHITQPEPNAELQAML